LHTVRVASNLIIDACERLGSSDERDRKASCYPPYRIEQKFGTAGNLPFAAAAAMVPVVTIIAYLLMVRRSGALDNL
jgi:hypothetical protein